MNIQILILGIVFVIGRQSVQAAAMPQLSPTDQQRFERRLAEQRTKAKQSKMVHQSRAPLGADLRQLQGAIAQAQTPGVLPKVPSSASSSSLWSTPPRAEPEPDPAAIAAMLRQVSACVKCAFPLSSPFELTSFANALGRSKPGKYLFNGSNFVDATPAQVLRTWGTRFPQGKVISRPADLKDWAHFYQTLATNPDTRALAAIAQKIDTNQPGLSFEDALKKVSLRYADILTDTKNIRDFSTYKKNIVSILKTKKQVYANRENRGLQDVVAAIEEESQKLIASFIYCIAVNQWNKETSSNQNIVYGNEFKQMVVNSAIAVLYQMKHGTPFFPSMHRVFGKFYLGSSPSSASSSSSSPDQPFIQL